MHRHINFQIIPLDITSLPATEVIIAVGYNEHKAGWLNIGMAAAVGRQNPNPLYPLHRLLKLGSEGRWIAGHPRFSGRFPDEFIRRVPEQLCVAAEVFGRLGKPIVRFHSNIKSNFPDAFTFNIRPDDGWMNMRFPQTEKDNNKAIVDNEGGTQPVPGQNPDLRDGVTD